MRQENSPSSQYTIVIQLILLVVTLEQLNSCYDPVTTFWNSSTALSGGYYNVWLCVSMTFL